MPNCRLGLVNGDDYPLASLAIFGIDNMHCFCSGHTEQQRARVRRIVRIALYHLAGFQGLMYFGFGNAPFVHPFDRVLSVYQLQGFTPGHL
jgi:hypothetical protein